MVVGMCTGSQTRLTILIKIKRERDEIAPISLGCQFGSSIPFLVGLINSLFLDLAYFSDKLSRTSHFLLSPL